MLLGSGYVLLAFLRADLVEHRHWLTEGQLLDAIAMGYDLFDCVLPTRNARNGSAFTSAGRISIKQAVYRRDGQPLDPRCDCRPCRQFSRAYLRHLYLSGEILAARALTEH